MFQNTDSKIHEIRQSDLRIEEKGPNENPTILTTMASTNEQIREKTDEKIIENEIIIPNGKIQEKINREVAIKKPMFANNAQNPNRMVLNRTGHEGQ